MRDSAFRQKRTGTGELYTNTYMWLIILLLILAALLMTAEIVFLPGISVAGFLALAADCTAAYIAYERFGTTGLTLAIAAVIIISAITLILCLRAKTWRRLSLKSKIEGQSQQSPDAEIEIGQTGVTLSRLAPMGKVQIGGRTFEAKTIDSFVDPKTEVTVTGFDNFTVIVKQTNNNSKKS